MKKLALLVLSLFITVQLYSQSQGISYQAVIIDKNDQEIPGVDISGNIIPNRPILVRFSILDLAGTIDYQEEHSTSTDEFGMINLIIGKGTQTINSPLAFNEIDWNGTPKDLKVDISLSQTNVFYADFSLQELNFVPYAYHKNITATGSLSVDGVTALKNRVDVTNGSPTFLSGTLSVSKSALLKKDLTVDSVSNLNGIVTINANVDGDETDYNAYPLRIQGSNQGIAVKIDGSRSSSNNYITFWDDEAIQGRIEGQTTVDLLTDPEYIFDNVLFAIDLTVATAEEIGAIAAVAAASTSSTGCVGVGVCVTTPIPSLIFDAIKDLVIKSATLVMAISEPIAYNVFKHTQIGISYQSGAGDYAEWLLKSDINEKFSPGDIVGVKGGLISKSTDNSDHYLVISFQPIVLGNMPKQGDEYKYEKVAFMGQVPVKVIGKVQIGDYILPSGNNNGAAIAVSPKNMQPDQYQKIVGIAWESNETNSFSYINVAVGLNANDVARLSLKQQHEIENQKEEINGLKSQINKMNEVLAQLIPNYAASMQMDQNVVSTNTSVISNKKSQEDNTQKTNTVQSYAQFENITYYYSLTKAQLEEGIALAEKELRDKGVDISKNPFFIKLNTDPEYRSIYIDKIVNSINKKIDENMLKDSSKGVKAIKL